jgi:hypothetical protein
MKINCFTAIITGALLSPTLLFSAPPATAQVTFGNVGSEPVSGVVGSGSNHPTAAKTVPTFDNGVQAKVNAASSGLTVAGVSGTQTVLGQTVTVDAAVMQTAFDLINTPVGSSSPSVTAFAQSLGNSSSGQNLAIAMQGLRRGDGSIDPTVMTNAVGAYNSYVQALATEAKATSKPSNELDSYVQSLPPGQKVAQVLLGKLLESAK